MQRTDLILSLLFYALLITMLVFAIHAHAVGIGNDNPAGGGGTTTVDQKQTVSVGIGISSDTRSSAAAYAGGGTGGSSSAFGGAGGSSSASGGSSTAGGAVSNNSMTINQASSSGDVKIRNVPDINSPSVYPTSPCMGSTSVGGSGVGFGISVGSSWKDDECGIRETARSFQALKLIDDALAVLCSSQYAKAAPSCEIKR